MKTRRVTFLVLTLLAWLRVNAAELRSLRFVAETPEAARRWQEESRSRLFALLMGGGKPVAGPLRPEILRREDVPAGGYLLEELTLQSLPDRRLHAWMAVPRNPRGRVGAVLAIHGHGGTGEEIVRGRSLYGHGRALAELGYVVIAPDVGQHALQHPGWSLMGERTWDALRCLDYLETRPEVDRDRWAVAGLSLGGETTMYVAALDPRVKVVDSSGWLTTVANMKNGHCTCYDFPGLEEHFDFADIFACVAPRPLVLELGEKERAPGGFPVGIGRGAFEEIRKAYRVLGAENAVTLSVHGGGHVFVGRDFWGPLRQTLGAAGPWVTPGESRRPDESELLRRGELARRCLSRALGVLDGWWATRDAVTGLYPRRLDQPVWAPADNAADMLPFLALTAHFLAPDRLFGIVDVIAREQALTTRHAGLPDWLSLTNRTWAYADTNLFRLIFGGAEYCKDGLLPMTEAMGRGPWVERMTGLIDAIFAAAPVETEYGMLPTDDSEVNGDLLQVLARLRALTGDGKYLRWAERIGDAYCLEVLPRTGGLPPHRWDFAAHRATRDVLNLNDHGNELIGGLAELYVATRHFHPERAALYEPSLRTLFRRLLDRARNEDGLWFNLVTATTGEVQNRDTPDTWGYAMAAAHTFGTAVGDSALTEAARQALRGVHRPRYLLWSDADAYADAIEGALLLLNRMPEPAGFAWLESMLPLFLSKQREDGIIEGWYGDGNYARTALMTGLYYTQGVTCQPWRPDLRVGAIREGATLRLVLAADHAWEGTLRFDVPRHREHLRLPVNYARLNEFPEWYTVDAAREYRVVVGSEPPKVRTGRELSGGLWIGVGAGRPVEVTVTVTVTVSSPGP